MRGVCLGVLVAAATGVAGAACAEDVRDADAPARVGQALAGRPGVVAVHRDVALVCDEAPAHGDAPDVIPDCDAALLDGGDLRPLGRGGLLAAQRLDADRLLLLTRDLRAVARDARGRERTIATAVADPRVADDGLRVVWTELPPGTTEILPGTPGRIVLVDLARGTRRVVTDHPLDSSPFVVPGSDDVLFVSGRTGVASLWLARPGARPRQLTNVGLAAVGSGFVPVPGRELAWIPGTRRAVYTASWGGRQERWTIDVDTGAAGRLPPEQR